MVFALTLAHWGECGWDTLWYGWERYVQSCVSIMS